VLLWPDTVNNFIHPEIAEAAVAVLEAAGFSVELPEGSVCCGRPLYDFGLLEAARRKLEDALAVLAEPLAAGVPVVVLEPSCASVFRDELGRLFPARDDARRLGRQTFLLGELLARHSPDFRPPALAGQALVHGHCHQKSVLGMAEDLALLAATGLELVTPDSGCCGLAGSFGFQKAHYDVSMAIGERVLLPAVRAMPAEALIVTNGFSCREQIAHGTGRRALHLAEVLAQGLAGAGEGGAPGI
jgi:Fe-S oxidoreductase